MNIFKNILRINEQIPAYKKYFSKKARPKDIINYFKMSYSKARDEKLNEDEHKYLADTLLLILEGKKNLDTAERDLGSLGQRHYVEFVSFQ